MSPLLGSIGGLSARAYGFQTATAARFEPDGAYDALATVTVPSAGLASIEFAAIPNTYKHLQIRGISRSTDSAAYTQNKLTINGVTTNYTLHQLFVDGSTPSAYGVTGQASTQFESMAADTATANIYGAAIIDILDYQSTNKYKIFRILAGYDANGSGRLALTSGMTTTNTNAVTSVALSPRFGNFKQYSQFTLYGVK
jgi:hypothetical protein